MTKSKKEFKNLNCKLDKEISDKLEDFAAKTRLSKTAAIENAVLYYIDRYEKTGRI